MAAIGHGRVTILCQVQLVLHAGRQPVRGSCPALVLGGRAVAPLHDTRPELIGEGQVATSSPACVRVK